MRPGSAGLTPASTRANPFEQTDGRPYRPEEELVARLEAGDWLEFEVEATAQVSALDNARRGRPGAT